MMVITQIFSNTDIQDVDFEVDPAAFSKSPEIIMSPPAGGEPVSILRQRSVDVTKEGSMYD